ncbi:MAG: type II toxin-antitoxin system YoeB family toxin [Nitrosomonas sp.]
MIKAIQQNPFEGIGKPEPLKHRLSSYGSRRINDEHRISIKSLTTIYSSLSFAITINFAPLRPAKRLIHTFRWCWWRAIIVKFR